MIKRIERELKAEKLIAPGERIVIGVSGGADSIALLHVLYEISTSRGWNLDLTVAHLDHGLRGAASTDDAGFARELAERLELRFVSETRDVQADSDRTGTSVEEAARNARYAFFSSVCTRAGARKVATGHQADDNAETILQRVLRGTGLRGLAGIPRRREITPRSGIEVVRPLLRISGAEVRAFLGERGIAHREDASNSSTAFTRNRIRNELLPLAENAVNPGVRDALARLGEQASWLNDFLGETVQRTFATLVIDQTDQLLSLNASALARKSTIVQSEIVRLAYRAFGLGEQALSFHHLKSALDLLADESSGKHVSLPAGVVVEKRYHQLTFRLPSDEPREDLAEEIVVRLPGTTVLPVRRLEIETQVKPLSQGAWQMVRQSSTPFDEYLDFENLHKPLVVRRRRKGDRFFPLGAPGTKTVSDFLTDAKVDPAERDRVPLLCDKLGPVWLVGHRIDDRVKLTPQSRQVLCVHVRHEGPERA